MKWFLIGLVTVFCSATLVRGDAAGELYKAGIDALATENYNDAVKDFTQIITGYPTTPNIDEVRIRAGFAYLHLGDFANAVKILDPVSNLKAKPEFRGTGLYFTGLAQFSQAQKAADKAASKVAYGQAAGTFTTLIDFINKNPTPDNKAFMEDTIYYRALSYFQMEDFANAEKDLLTLLNPPYTASLKRPDYTLLLGSLYGFQTNLAVSAKAASDVIKADAQKALDRYMQVSTDPNALVQANDANMSMAEVYYLIAQLPDGGGYQKALDAYRLVRRKADMIQIQQARLEKMKKDSAAALANNPAGATIANENVRLIDRESGRLATLKEGPDPIIQALIRIAECYNAMKPPMADEARVVLRRLAQAPLTTEQKQEVDFQLLNSYVLGAQTDKADAALTDYLTKHPADSQADSFSYQIAGKLMEKKDYEGALKAADRSLSDFPKGRVASDVHSLKATAYKNLGQLTKATDELKLAADSAGASGFSNQLNSAGIMASQGNLAGALDMYKKVKDNPAAGEAQAYGAAGYITTLQAMGKYDDVITEAKAFAAKYPEPNKALPGVLIYQGLAMDKKNDPAAVAHLQEVARKFPKDESSPFALFYVVTIYQRTGNVAGMVQAAKDLATTYPTAYTFLGQAADLVGDEYVKEKKFDLAVAAYQPLVDAPKADVAAAADNKIGGVWIAAVKAKGAMQSMPADKREEPKAWLDNADKAYLTVLTKFPDQVDAVGNAFQGLAEVLKVRRSNGLLTDADMEAALAKLTAGLTTPEMQTRVELAKAGLVFVYKKGQEQYPAALARFKKVVEANPNLILTRQEANQYGDLLLATKDYSTAIQVYTNLLSHSAPNDFYAQADGNYGLGAIYLAQGDVSKAAEYFAKVKALAPGYWSSHADDVSYGLALAAEQAGDPNGLAKQTYARLMQSVQAGIPLQAKAMIGYGRLLEKAGYGVAPAVKGTIEFAVHYFQQVDVDYSMAVPQLSAEGLYDAGQAFEKAGDKASAKAQYAKILTVYAKAAPDWAAKAQAASDKLGQ